MLSQFIALSLTVPILIFFVLIMYKVITRKALPYSNYTPYDYITGQSSVEINEDKIDIEQEDDKGDDKDKNNKK